MPQDLIDDYSILVQVLAWYCQDNQLPEPMLTKFYDIMSSLGHNE